MVLVTPRPITAAKESIEPTPSTSLEFARYQRTMSALDSDVHGQARLRLDAHGKIARGHTGGGGRKRASRSGSRMRSALDKVVYVSGRGETAATSEPRQPGGDAP
jgi:hypothetical protein